MIEKGIDRSFSAMNQVDYALGQAGFLQQFEDTLHGERNAFALFQNKSVAGGDGVGQKPEGDHAGKIEGSDGGDDSHGLANHHFIDAPCDVFQVVALHHHRNAASDFDVFDGAAKFGFGFGQSLAVFDGDQAAQLIDVFFEQHFQFEERLNAVFGRCAAPVGKCGGGGFDRGVHFAAVGERNSSEGRVSGGIDERLPFTGFGVDPVTGDEVGYADVGDGCGAHWQYLGDREELKGIKRLSISSKV
jgi:hypothetical protein